MRLVCPSCGAIASQEAWSNDTTIRYFQEVLTQLPSPVLRQTLTYLGLFRQGTNALPWKRALILARDLKALVETGSVHWQGGETRPCNAEIWGKAMEAVITAKPVGLKNHNYLRKCAWDMAAELAAKAETARETARQRRTRDDHDEPGQMSEKDSQAFAELKKKLGL